MSQPTLLMLGTAGTRWLFGIVVAYVLAAWGRESWLGVISPHDRVAYPVLALAFAVLSGLAWRRPQRLRHWQRWGVTLLALYFTLALLAFTLRPDPGPDLYTLGSFGPWTLAGCLLLFTAWRATQALWISLGLLALMMAPSILLRFAGHPPHWLVDAWPLLANLALCQATFCVALWGLSRQIARLVQLAPTGSGLATAHELVQARVLELERSQAAAEAASRAKSEFLASIGHEIRTPMNTVLGQTRLLLDGRLLAEQRQQLQEVMRAGESLVKLIDGLLDYSDLDVGRMQLHSQPLHLETLIGSAIDCVRPAAQGRQLELLCEIAPELLGPAGMRLGDAQRITQLITELLVNAVKFTPSGQVRLTAALLDGGAWQLQVRDSGVGMTPAQLARLFTPFAQAEAHASRRFAGIGLGLAICRALVERMGGTLKARSTPGRGSEFELVLPLPPCTDTAPPPPAAELRSILIVQATHSAGHEALVSLVKALAPTAQVEVLSQGSLVLQRLARTPASEPHDLMLVDWVLPDMEGSQLLQRLAEAGSPGAQRIVLLGAFDTPVLRERAQRQGAHALAAMPLLPHTLRRLMDLSRQLPAAEPSLPGDNAPGDTDPNTLLAELDHLLSEADSDALMLWERHGSAFIELLPAPQAKALASAMQRLDFDAAQAALRGRYKP